MSFITCLALAYFPASYVYALLEWNQYRKSCLKVGQKPKLPDPCNLALTPILLPLALALWLMGMGDEQK
jgi:hypothetical protein